MKKHLFISVLFILSAFSLKATDKISINSGWLFHSEVQPKPVFVNFPHTWNAADAIDDEPGYFRGMGYYTKDITIVEEQLVGKCVYIYFEGANQVLTLTVNGHAAGTHRGGYTRFCFDVTPFIKPGKNRFEIALTNAHDDNIPPLSADFTFFGGVYRDVYLLIDNPIHISPLDAFSNGMYVRTPSVNASTADVEFELLLNNMNAERKKVTILYDVFAPDNSLIATLRKRTTLSPSAINASVKASLTITSPTLWDTENPNLYKVVATVLDSHGQVADRLMENFGLRWFSFDASKGFFLNGRHVKLVGTNRHQSYEGRGWAVTDEYHHQDIRLLKDLGANFLRISHYPQDPHILALCDRLGIIASVETPGNNCITPTNEFLHNSLLMQEEMIKQNFNHPSVIIWAYMNEVLLQGPSKDKEQYISTLNGFAKSIDSLSHAIDPARRTMLPCHGSIEAYEQAGLITIPDLIGWNLYSGWYGGEFSDFGLFLDTFHKRYPSVPMIVSEYGADNDRRIHSEKPERFDFSVEYADMYQESYLHDILSRDIVCGAALWNLNEFYAEPRKDAIPHVNPKGIVTLNRQPKNTYWLYKANFYHAEPFMTFANAEQTRFMAQLSPKGNISHHVKIFTNQKKVSLYHNGRFVATLPVKEGMAQTHVPLVNGRNVLSAWSDSSVQAIKEIYLDGIPFEIDRSFTALHCLLGTQRTFTDLHTQTTWMAEQPYRPHSWGYIGGQDFKQSHRNGNSPSASVNILQTDIDPLYQTQRVDIREFRADLPRGEYEVTLHFAALPQSGKLRYELSSDDGTTNNTSADIFDVVVNGNTILPAFSITEEAPIGTAVDKKLYVTVNDDKGLSVCFVPRQNHTFLNAISIVRMK